MPRKKKAIVSVKNVGKKYGDFEALKNITFDIERGKILAIIGPNGSGKSTLAKIILGLEKPTTGSVLVDRSNRSNPIGYVPQRLKFDRSIPMTVSEFLDLSACRDKKHCATKAQVEEVLHSVGMKDHRDRMLGVLSGGQFQRILIARALLHERELLILDEPDAGVDEESEKAIYEVLKEMNEKRGVTIVVISHELDFVTAYSDTVLCVNCSMVCYGDSKTTLKKDSMVHLYGSKHNHDHHHGH